MATRRSFIRTSALAGAAVGLAGPVDLVARALSQAAPRPLRILVLGGTGFIGPHQVRYAVARGHKLTLFNRGRTNPGLLTEARKAELRAGLSAEREAAVLAAWKARKG